MDAQNHETATYQSNPFLLIPRSYQAFLLMWKPLVLLGLIVAAAMIAFFVLIVVLATAFHSHSTSTGAQALIALLPVAILLVLAFGGLYGGWTATALILAGARGQRLAIRQAVPPKPIMVFQLLWTALLAALIVAGGFLLLLIPGIILCIWYVFVSFVVVDGDARGWAALRRSRELVRGHWAEVAAIILMPALLYPLLVVPILGFVVYVAASFVLAPISALRYNDLKTLKGSPEAAKTSTHPINYVVIVVGLVFMSVYTNYQIHLIQAIQQQQLEKTVQTY